MPASVVSAGTRLCRFDALEEGACVEVRCGDADQAASVMVVRVADAPRAYLNRCPHFSLPLNAGSRTFLTVGGREVMCAYHCALFRFEDGVCIDGPARGARLVAIPVALVEGHVVAL